jgi:lysozyme
MTHPANENLRASPACLAVIKGSEQCRLKAYLDTKKGRVPTIAWGHTANVKMGDTCTQAQADAWLISDVSYAESIVKKAVTIPLTQGQFDALVSFAYNVGHGKVGGPSGLVVLKNGNPSTLLRLVNAGEVGGRDPVTGNLIGAAGEFGKWVYDEGVKLGGLVTRRAAEAALFMGA